ncbi:PREDICTED: ubiquitin-like protein ISG15 [Condylura cristata]|uniref:ubiquitin-like protein ISG15 n=1 Tax=Condylura cristata TaxID=143302 RepID=UPI0006432592|nr:PREDICTED: ubiquitin-like protein ISG15 [Condylura cristata]
MLGGVEFRVPFQGAMLGQELKQQVALEAGVPAFQQRLVLQATGAALRDGEPLARQGLGPDSTVLLAVQPCDTPLSILVRTSGGRSRAYEVLPTQTAAQLKQEVCRREGTSADQCWLSFQGTPMEDTQLLGDLGLTPQCTVHLNLRLRGGAPHTAPAPDLPV